MDDWVTLEDFPAYEVNRSGEIRRALSGSVLTPKVNQYGTVGVGLMRDGRQFHRSVPLLVASTFVPRPLPAFDTPINLDGDRRNNNVANLVWRPRWYAVAYNRQFSEPYPHPIEFPVLDRQTLDEYESSWTCATANGLLEKEVVLSILNRTHAWPTRQEFEVIER